MKRVGLPYLDDASIFDAVSALRTEEGESSVAGLRPLVLTLYARYLECLESASIRWAVATLTEADRVLLKDNWRYLKRKQFDPERSAILRAAPHGLCPFCYTLPASEIDHFMPRAKFGEFSIFIGNLVAICGTCNRKKGSRYCMVSGERRYAHPYHDNLPDEALVRASVKVDGGVWIDFFVELGPCSDTQLAKRIARQFSDLDVATHMSREAINELDCRLGSIYAYFDTGGEVAVSDYLRRDARSAAARFGEGHWKALTLNALAGSNEFCNGGFAEFGPDPMV